MTVRRRRDVRIIDPKNGVRAAGSRHNHQAWRLACVIEEPIYPVRRGPKLAPIGIQEGHAGVAE